MQKNSVTTKQQWTKAALNDPRYFSVVGSGVEAWVGKKNFLSTKSVQGTKIVAVEGEIDYLNRPSRANMQPKLGRVAFAKMKDTFKVLVADEVLSKKYILSTGFALIEPSIDSNYLYQYFQSEKFNLQKNRYSEGSTQQAISQSDFANVEILFPISRDEQKRIAEVLELIDQTIEQTDALIKKYERVRAGMMQDLFQYGIDENGQIRSEATHEFSNSQCGRIPKSWQVVEYAKTCTTIVVGIVIKPTQYYVENGVPALRSQNITEAGINYSDFVYISEKANKLLSKSVVRCGDIVTVRTGAPGTSTVIPRDLDGVNCIDIIISRPKKDTNSVFLSKYLNSFQGKRQVLVAQGGVAQQHFNVGELKKILVPLPSFDEQNEIAQRLIAIEAKIKVEQICKNKLTKIKSGLMTDLLTGAVRTTEK